MKTRLFNTFIFLCFARFGFAQITLCSWNLENFGKSKSDSEMVFIARTLKDFDVVAVVEVVAGDGGAKAVARLADDLNRTGNKWDYTISDPTLSSSPSKTERYAFIWKTSKVKLVGKAWLEQKYKLEIEREPYLATFDANGKEFTVATFHAITKSAQPEKEIKYFKLLPEEYPGKTLLFCGDFNCPESHTVFIPLKEMRYKPVFQKQKTSLKLECKNGECLASEFDNIFYDANKIQFQKSAVVQFYKKFPTLKEARMVSDHCPVYFEFSLN
jgi:deoxyribonuclease-1-like protein